jgi:predicted nucleotide-binding protein
MYEFLRALGLHPLEWTEIKEQTEGLNPYIGDILETGFAKAQTVVVIFTGDDEARLKEECRRKYDLAEEGELRPQPRPNVLFEAGMAMARFPKATILVQVGELRGMSDIAGRHLVRIDNSRAARTELARGPPEGWL